MTVRSPMSLDYPDLPAGAVLAGAAARWGERIALRSGDTECGYAELYRRACAFAHALHADGVGRGDVVAVHLANGVEFAVAYHGTLLSGATFTPANPLLPPAELATQLADSGAVLAVSSGPAARALAAVRDRTAVRRVVLAGHPAPAGSGADGAAGPADPEPADDGPGTVGFEEFLAGRPTTRPAVDLDPRRDLAHLAYTGGTTGASKAVALPHRNVVVNALQYACWNSGSVPRVSGDGLVVEQTAGPEEFPVRLGTGVAIALAPWFHAMGTIGGLHVPMLLGYTQVVHQRFDPARYLADVEAHGVTAVTGAPPVFAALVRHPDFATRRLGTVHSITSGAAPIPVELLDALRHRFGTDVVVVEGYGLTEVTMGATIGPAARSATRKVGTVGLPVADTEITLVDDAGDEVPVGQPGEVCIAGPQVMPGYRDRPAETAAVLVGGRLRTGDIGVLDEDGYLRIVDRAKDMLIYKGYNVYPGELEALLHTQAGVRAAAVVGRPDPEVGELPVAFVVAPGWGEADGQRLREAVNARLLPYQRLREVLLVDEIPVSAAGKVLKRELRARLDLSPTDRQEAR